MQELIFKENEKLNDFKNPKSQLIFQKIDFDYYPNFISKLYGQIDEWSCTFKSVKKYSKFNMDIMYNIILYLLIKQLQLLLWMLKCLHCCQFRQQMMNYPF